MAVGEYSSVSSQRDAEQADVERETRELARVRTGTIKRMRVDAVTACQNLESALAELSARTGISMTEVTRTCVGTAGETVPLVKDWLRESISARVGGGLLILGDVEIALEAAFPGGVRATGWGRPRPPHFRFPFRPAFRAGET